EIPMTAAALGSSVTVETLDGTETVDIKPGTQSGQVITLYNRGVRHPNESGRGDLLIHVNVDAPTKLDEGQEELLRRLAALRGEERPPGRVAPRQRGARSRLKHAANHR